MERYLEQWSRVKRWSERLEDLNSGPSMASSDEVLDFVYAFFLNCYHLKDWVKKVSPGIEDLFDRSKGNLHLKICADIANANKHLTLNNRARSTDQKTSIITQSVTVYVKIVQLNTPTPPGPGARYNFGISFENKTYDAYEVAQKCMGELEDYLGREGLL